MIIVIDGLSGSGKSSTAKAVAENLGIQYLDSGALYRVVTYIWMQEGKPKRSFLDILSSKDIRFEYKNRKFTVFVDGKDVTKEIRKQQISDHVSTIAAEPAVREFVNGLMRQAVRRNDYIADGRDLGSAVFPDADLKIFMEAALDVRAMRRYAELKASGEAVSLEQVKENLRKRDRKDTTREHDPLTIPDDACRIDTSGKSFDEQVGEITEIIRDRLSLNTDKQKP